MEYIIDILKNLSHGDIVGALKLMLRAGVWGGVFLPIILINLILNWAYYKPTELHAKLAIRTSLLLGTILFALASWLVIETLCNSKVESVHYFLLGQPNLTAFSHLIQVSGLGLLFMWLTTYLILLCLIYMAAEFNMDKITGPDLRTQLQCLLAVEALLMMAFFTSTLLNFYYAFEALLLPMYYMLLKKGSRTRKVRATYLLMFYTIVSSAILLITIFKLKNVYGISDFNLMYHNIKVTRLTDTIRREIFLGIFFAFAIKIPLFPFHTWLPEAHVEAPTIGSVLLAGILLKLGVFGMIKYCIIPFPEAANFYAPFIQAIALFGVLITSLTALRQTDYKRIIAYSSVGHMNLIVAGLFSNNIAGAMGAMFQSISHGIISGGLFFMIGILYLKSHTRLLPYYNSLVNIMPLFNIALLILTLANIATPGTSSFLGEFILFLGLSKSTFIGGILSAWSIVIGAGFGVWAYNRTAYLSENSFRAEGLRQNELGFLEKIIVLPSILMGIGLGFCPFAIAGNIEMDSARLIAAIANFLN